MNKTEVVDTTNTTNTGLGDPSLQVNGMRSEYELEELKIIFDALGQIPVTLNGDAIEKLTNLRNKIKNDFDIKQKNINKK